MNVPPAHVTDVDIERFRQRRLPGNALVAFTDHLASCDDCRRRVAERTAMTATWHALEDALGIDGNDHVAESEIHAFVDGSLDADRRREVSAHLARCPACAEEIRDLQELAAQLGRPVWWQRRWTYGALAAAAVLVLGVALTLWSRTQGSRQVATLADATGQVTLDSRGSLAGVGVLASADQDRVRQALETGRLSVPPTLPDLIGRRGALMGPADVSAFHLVAPVGTAVLGTGPTLRWTPLPGATSYVVTLQEQASGETMNSPPLTVAEWTPERPLIRGRSYAWQVAGSTSGTEVVTPKPPDPPARFMVAGASEAERLERLPASHLVRGVLYANAGLLDDAERELAALSVQNPNSEVVDRLLKQIRGSRP